MRRACVHTVTAQKQPGDAAKAQANTVIVVPWTDHRSISHYFNTRLHPSKMQLCRCKDVTAGAKFCSWPASIKQEGGCGDTQAVQVCLALVPSGVQNAEYCLPR